jgi:hypothetical protein
MKNKKELSEEYIDFLYKESKDDEMYSPEVTQSKLDFIQGFLAKQNQTDKIILDLLNKHRSNLATEETPKLGRTANYEKTTSYKAYIEILTELRNKLK